MGELLAGVLILVLMTYLVFQIESPLHTFFTSQGGSDSIWPGQAVKDVMTAMDYGVLIFLVMSMISILILSFFIPSHPIFSVAYLILILVLIYLTPVYVHIYSIIANTIPLVTYFDEFPIANAIFSNLPMIMILFSGVVAVITYAKPQTGQSGLAGLG